MLCLNPALIRMAASQTAPYRKSSALGRLEKRFRFDKECRLVWCIWSLSGVTPHKDLQQDFGLERNVYVHCTSTVRVQHTHTHARRKARALKPHIRPLVLYTKQNVARSCYDNIHDYDYELVGWRIFTHRLLSLFSGIIKSRPNGKETTLFLYSSFTHQSQASCSGHGFLYSFTSHTFPTCSTALKLQCVMFLSVHVYSDD